MPSSFSDGNDVNRLGLDFQSVFGMPPLAYVGLAADLGCSHVTIGLGPSPWNPCAFAPWSLRDDASLRRATRDLMHERGVAISVLYGFSLKPDMNVAGFARDMDLAAELGAGFIGTVGMDPDLARAYDNLAQLTSLAVERELEVVLDYAPHHPINTLGAACQALRSTGSPHARLSVDAMHLFRSGGAAAEVAALAAADPGRIGYAQVCDAMARAPHPDYAKEVTFERLIPGDGELPLADLIAAVPADVLIGVEVPNLQAAETDLHAFLARAVAASRALLPEMER